MSAVDSIVDTISDMRHNRVQWIRQTTPEIARYLTAARPVVDITPIYNQLAATAPHEYDLYEDFVLLPPWIEVDYAFENRFGNVIIISAFSTQGASDVANAMGWESENEIPWDDVAYLTIATLFIGGRSHEQNAKIPTSGPMFMWRWAVDERGYAYDLNWLQLLDDEDYKQYFTADALMTEFLTLVTAVNFLNCRNVQLVEPHRPRAQQRRLQRADVRLSEIHITPIGKSYRHSTTLAPGSAPLTSVRGHFAEYGEQYGKGKLFGRIEGRFWIPQHARGSAENGEVQQHFIVEGS